MSSSSKTAFILGYPVGHSRSPLIHGFWLKENGIEGQYVHKEISSGDLGAFIKQLDPQKFVGGNVTIPHKENVFILLEDLTDEARGLKAVNTLYWEEERLIGHNTDGYGFISHLKATLGDNLSGIKTALILGAGGAARPIIFSLMGEGVKQIIISNRTKQRAQEIVDDFKTPECELKVVNWEEISKQVPEADLIVNTTSLGMIGNPPLQIDLAEMKNGTYVYDIVYAPIETALLNQAKSKGGIPIDGLGMLLHQAVPGFEKWFGVRPRVTEALRDYILADLEQNA